MEALGAEGSVWESTEEGIAGHLSNLRCLSDSENISLNIYIYITVYSSLPHTHTQRLYLHICYFFPCIVGPHTCFGWLEEAQ